MSYGFDLPGLVGLDNDSGTDKVAHLEFRLRDGYVPTSIVWSPDGRFIATSGTQTRSIHVWDVEQRKLVKELTLPNSPAGLFHNMAWSADGRYLAICNSFETSLRIYNANDWSVAKDFGRKDAIACQKPAFSTDSQELTVWAGDLTTFSTTDWHEIRRLQGVIDDGQYARKLKTAWDSGILIRDMVYIPGTHTLAFGGGQYEHKVIESCGLAPQAYAGRLWTLDSNETALTRSLVVYCAPRGADVKYLAFHPNGQQLVTTSESSAAAKDEGRDSAHVLTFPQGQLLGAPLDRLTNSPTEALLYTPDGRYILAGQSAKSVSPLYIIDAKTLQVLDVVSAANTIHGLAAHPKSALFAAAAGDGVTVWKFVSP